MTKNIGKTDKMVRIVTGLILILLGIYLAGWFWLLVLVGLALVVTAFIGYCGLYQLLGTSTCKECKNTPPAPPIVNTPPTTPPTPPTVN